MIWTVAIEGIANWQALWFAATLAVAVGLLAARIGKAEAEQQQGSRA